MQTRRIIKHCLYFSLIVPALVFRTLPCGAQVTVTATLSDPAPSPGSVFEITLALNGETDIYYAETEVSYDPGSLEFVSVSCTGLTHGGISIAGELQPGLTGASVSRTEPLPEPAGGPFMLLSFRVRNSAFTGITLISFFGPGILDSAGETVPAGAIDPVSPEIPGAITYTGLTGPAFGQINEGELFYTGAAVFASGITDDERIICQVGVSAGDSDPGSWDDNLWSDMLFEGYDEDHYLQYSAEIAFMRPAGEWYIAVRSSLDGGEFVYGGSGGPWDPVDNQCARLDIIARPPYRYTVAEWDFDDESYAPSVFMPENAASHVTLTGASLQGFSTGASGLSANSNGWDGGADGSKYWAVDISAGSVGSLMLSSKQSGSNTGPRDFVVEYSLDGELWYLVEGSEVAVGNNWSAGALDNLPLPGVLSGRERILLRWAMISETSIGGGTVGSVGTGRIDDIVISGVNPDPVTVQVYPGDTNNDGAVNADDVLALGTWWLYRGPPSVWTTGDFEGRSTEQWITADATWADTNGDGVVDHRDLAAVGFHFGKSLGGGTKDGAGPLSSVTVDPSGGNGKVGMMLATPDMTGLRGIAFSISVKDIPAGMWEVREAYQAFAGDAENDDILDFEIMHDDLYEAAFTLKGRGEDIKASTLAGFQVVVPEGWTEPFSVELNRATISKGSGIAMPAAGAELVPAGIVGTGSVVILGEEGGLLQRNYPNPFSSVTTIPFRMKDTGAVRLEILDMKGSLVSVPADALFTAGHYEIIFEGSTLPPGIYLCRLKASGNQPEVMLMIKSE